MNTQIEGADCRRDRLSMGLWEWSEPVLSSGRGGLEGIHDPQLSKLLTIVEAFSPENICIGPFRSGDNHRVPPRQRESLHHFRGTIVSSPFYQTVLGEHFTGPGCASYSLIPEPRLRSLNL